mgnify:CR=1 FL=1
MIFSAILAIGKNGQIGLNNGIPWKLKDDMIFFKNTTTNHVVVFGRKTFESIKKPLKNRINVILTKNPNYKMSVFDVPTITKEAIVYILTNPKFTGEMLASNLKKIQPRLNCDELHELISIKGLTDDTNITDNIILDAIKNGNIELIYALTHNENINFSNNFYDEYFSNLRPNLKYIYDDLFRNQDEVCLLLYDTYRYRIFGKISGYDD